MSPRRLAIAQLLLSRGAFFTVIGGLAGIGGVVEWTIDLSPRHGPLELAIPTILGAVLGALTVLIALAVAYGSAWVREPHVRRMAIASLTGSAALVGVAVLLLLGPG